MYEGGENDRAGNCPPIASFSINQALPVDAVVRLEFTMDEDRALLMRALNDATNQPLGEYRSLRDQPGAAAVAAIGGLAINRNR